MQLHRRVAAVDCRDARLAAPRSARSSRSDPHIGNARLAQLPQTPSSPRGISNIGALSQRNVAARAAATVVAPERPIPPPDAHVPVEGVFAFPITKTTTCLRGICNERLKYEVEYGLKQGTSENSYLIKAPGGGNVLIDIPFKAFLDPFLACLSEQLDPRDLTHLVITHVGPNRTPTIAAVLRAALAGRAADQPLKVVASNPAIKVLRSGLTGDDAELLDQVELQVIKGSDDVVAVNPNYILKPLLTPTPRWPDLMCVLDPASKMLYTSKLFSAHVAPGLLNERAKSSAFDEGAWESYQDHWRFFFECMLAPVPKQALAALDKLPITGTPRVVSDTPKQFVSSLLQTWGALVSDITRGAQPANAKAALLVYALAPQHGPVVRRALNQLVLQYRRWAEAQVEAMSTSNVTVFYASAYGNTAALAQAISHGLTKAGMAVNTINLELASPDEVQHAIKATNGFVIGSPTLGGHMPTQVQIALGSILRESSARDLPCGVFGSFGWSGEAVDEMESKLKDGGFGFAFDPIKVKFKPTAKDLITCERSGRDLAVQVKRKMKRKEKSSTASLAATTAASGAQLAMGRVVGSLAVVTARDEDATAALLATWIAQASFNPPGLTVAVKKDRGMETMLAPGAQFAVSLVPESKERVIMRAMSRPFLAGQDRLAALDTKDSEVSGCPVLEDSHSVLDCKVVSRMDAGDHTVVYAEVLAGHLNKEAEQTAVLHRKVGNHY